MLEFAVAGIAFVVEPGFLLAPIDVFLGLENVGATAAETEWLEAHRLERAVAGEHHEVGP